MYYGGLNGADIANFASDLMENFVRIVTDRNYEIFSTEDPKKLKLLVFTSKK